MKQSNNNGVRADHIKTSVTDELRVTVDVPDRPDLVVGGLAAVLEGRRANTVNITSLTYNIRMLTLTRDGQFAGRIPMAHFFLTAEGPHEDLQNAKSGIDSGRFWSQAHEPGSQIQAYRELQIRMLQERSCWQFNLFLDTPDRRGIVRKVCTEVTGNLSSFHTVTAAKETERFNFEAQIFCPTRQIAAHLQRSLVRLQSFERYDIFSMTPPFSRYQPLAA